MGNAESRQRRTVLVDFDGSCLASDVRECADVLEAVDAVASPGVRMARWSLALTRGETREIPSHGTALLGFRTTTQGGGTVHVNIGTHVRYAVHVPAGGQLVPALFGTSALPVGALPRERIVVTAPPTADVEAVYALIPGDPYELNYDGAYIPWTLNAPSGLLVVAANGKLWPLSDVAELPLQYPSSSRDAKAA